MSQVVGLTRIGIDRFATGESAEVGKIGVPFLIGPLEILWCRARKMKLAFSKSFVGLGSTSMVAANCVASPGVSVTSVIPSEKNSCSGSPSILSIR
jgi:hypothetical protein